LTTLESHVYSYLLILGGAEAQKLILLLDRKRVEVYRTLKRLVKMGFVNNTSLTPSFYSPVIPNDLITQKIENHKRIIQKLTILNNLLLSNLVTTSNLNVWKIQSLDLLSKYMKDLIKKSTKYMAFYLNNGLCRYIYNDFFKGIKEDKNIEIEIYIFTSDNCIYPYLGQYNLNIINKELKYIFFNVDNNKCILKQTEQNSFIYSECDSICTIIKKLFDIIVKEC